MFVVEQCLLLLIWVWCVFVVLLMCAVVVFLSLFVGDRRCLFASFLAFLMLLGVGCCRMLLFVVACVCWLWLCVVRCLLLLFVGCCFRFVLLNAVVCVSLLFVVVWCH